MCHVSTAWHVAPTANCHCCEQFQPCITFPALDLNINKQTWKLVVQWTPRGHTVHMCHHLYSQSWLGQHPAVTHTSNLKGGKPHAVAAHAAAAPTTRAYVNPHTCRRCPHARAGPSSSPASSPTPCCRQGAAGWAHSCCCCRRHCCLTACPSTRLMRSCPAQHPPPPRGTAAPRWRPPPRPR